MEIYGRYRSVGFSLHFQFICLIKICQGIFWRRAYGDFTIRKHGWLRICCLKQSRYRAICISYYLSRCALNSVLTWRRSAEVVDFRRTGIYTRHHNRLGRWALALSKTRCWWANILRRCSLDFSQLETACAPYGDVKSFSDQPDAGPPKKTLVTDDKSKTADDVPQKQKEKHELMGQYLTYAVEYIFLLIFLRINHFRGDIYSARVYATPRWRNLVVGSIQANWSTFWLVWRH